MGKGGGGGGQPTETTVTQTDLPEYVKPYFERLLKRGESLSKEEYTPFTGQRIATATDPTLRSRERIEEIATRASPRADQAQQAVSDALGRFQQTQNFQASQVSPISGTIDFNAPQMFTGDVAQQYMSPYMDQVLERQKEGLRKDFARTQAERDAQAVKAGAFGGSRQAVAQSLAEENLIDKLADVEATGRQQAFEQASAQFERDRAAGMSAEEFQVRATQAAQESRLRAEVEQENLRVNAEKLGMSAAEASTMGAERLAALERSVRAGDVDSAKLLEAIGRDQEARKQLELDVGREDFIRQRDIPAERLHQFSSLLRGVPVSPSQEAATLRQVNPAQELLGTGISALSLYKALGS